jgi:hypothetical protein
MSSFNAWHAPLHFAAESGNLEIVKTLVAARANLFAVDVCFVVRRFPRFF